MKKIAKNRLRVDVESIRPLRTVDMPEVKGGVVARTGANNYCISVYCTEALVH